MPIVFEKISIPYNSTLKMKKTLKYDNNKFLFEKKKKKSISFYNNNTMILFFQTFEFDLNG